jgi:hypothetical protein
MQAHTDALPLALEQAGEPRRRQAAARSVQDRVLPALALGASLAMTISAMAQGQAGQFARECALKEIAAITVIEDHGVALYESIHNLGPVASLRGQRP